MVSFPFLTPLPSLISRERVAPSRGPNPNSRIRSPLYCYAHGFSPPSLRALLVRGSRRPGVPLPPCPHTFDSFSRCELVPAGGPDPLVPQGLSVAHSSPLLGKRSHCQGGPSYCRCPLFPTHGRVYRGTVRGAQPPGAKDPRRCVVFFPELQTDSADRGPNTLPLSSAALFDP